MVIQELTINRNQVQVALSGSIYVENVAEILDRFNRLIDKGHTTFIVDLSLVDYIDSAGLGTLIAIHKRALSLSGGLMIKGQKGLIKELLELTRIDKVLAVE